MLRLIVLLVGVLLLAACGGIAESSVPVSLAPESVPQVVEGGGVAVEVTRQAGDQLAFTVAMNTHAVDLDGVDLRVLAVLRDGMGREAAPTAWTAPPGGHHRSGELRFAHGELDEQGPLELVIRDVAGVSERVFRWEH